MKSIHELALHEEIGLCGGLYIMRVPGGWRYLDQHPVTGAIASTFVPYNDEFRPNQWNAGLSSRTKNKE